MSDMNSTNSRKSPNEIGNFPTIEALASEHDRISREIDELPLTRAAEEQRRRLNDRLWAIRALIAATPSKTQSELQAKTRIFEFEAARDADFECYVPGSARDLSRSIALDVMALKIAA